MLLAFVRLTSVYCIMYPLATLPSLHSTSTIYENQTFGHFWGKFAFLPCNLDKLVYLHFIQAIAHHWRTDNNFAGRNAESPLIVSEPQQLWVRVELAFSLKHFQFPPPPTVTKQRNIWAVLMNDGQKSDDIDHDLTENIAFTLVPVAGQRRAAVPWA